MSASRHRPRHFESVVSICLLAIILLIAVGVFLKQYETDMARFGMNIEAVPDPGITFELDSVVPEGFEALSPATTYTAENLYEKINGKAPFYTESGFQKLSTQLFVSKDKSLQMELYLFDMGTAKNAFSVYSVQKRPDVELLPVMEFAYETSNALYFARGRYYVELIGFSESNELLEAMLQTGRKLQVNLPIDDVEITELNLFPADNIVEGGIKLYLKNAFGFEGLTDTFTAQYKLNGEAITAFFIKRSADRQAKDTAERYYKFLIDNGGRLIPSTNPRTKLVDFYGMTEIIFTTGPFVGGIHEAENRQAAQELAQNVLNKLDRVAGLMNDE